MTLTNHALKRDVILTYRGLHAYKLPLTLHFYFRMFQKVAGLQQTEQLDRDTVQHMNLLRCGVKDMEDEQQLKGSVPPGVHALAARLGNSIALTDGEFSFCHSLMYRPLPHLFFSVFLIKPFSLL